MNYSVLIHEHSVDNEKQPIECVFYNGTKKKEGRREVIELEGWLAIAIAYSFHVNQTRSASYRMRFLTDFPTFVA